MKDDGSSTTAGDLIDALSALPRNTKIRFQGGLTFYRLKRRGDDLVQVEFNEPVFDALSHYTKIQK